MAQKLSEYKRKRDPKQTPEPFGSTKGKAKDPIFVVQRHDARRLHYDFRLEKDGTLLSWAVVPADHVLLLITVGTDLSNVPALRQERKT